MRRNPCKKLGADGCHVTLPVLISAHFGAARSEEHTSELQSQSNLVCRLLLEKKKTYMRTGPRTCMNSVRCHRPANTLFHGSNRYTKAWCLWSENVQYTR